MKNCRFPDNFDKIWNHEVSLDFQPPLKIYLKTKSNYLRGRENYL